MKTRSRSVVGPRSSPFARLAVSFVLFSTVAVSACTTSDGSGGDGSGGGATSDVADTDDAVSEAVEADDPAGATVESTVPGADTAIETDGSEVSSSSSSLQVRPVLRSLGFEPDDGGLGDDAEGEKVLLDRDGETFVVGRALSGSVFSGAMVTDQLGFGVTLTLAGPDAADAFNTLADECFAVALTCPTGRIAIVFDDVVLSAPTVNGAEFTDNVVVTGRFTQQEAEDLADSINAAN